MCHYETVERVVISKMIKFTIPLDPKTKKNSGRICRNKYSGKTFFRPSEAFEQYQENCGYFMPKLKNPIEYKVNIKALYFMGTRRKVDITNLHSALHDILTHYGVIADDNMKIVISTDGSRVRYDKNNPRTEVEITETDEITGFE